MEKVDYDVLFQRAREGDGEAENELAWRFLSGIELPQREVPGMYWLVLSALSGNADAQYKLSVLFEQEALYGEWDGAVDLMLFWFVKAIEQGHVEACVKLAWWYELSDKNGEKAVEYYKKGFELGDNECCKRLSRLFAEGKIVPKDEERSKRWLKIYEFMKEKEKNNGGE